MLGERPGSDGRGQRNFEARSRPEVQGDLLPGLEGGAGGGVGGGGGGVEEQGSQRDCNKFFDGQGQEALCGTESGLR
jgi:hypothetical protein